MWPQTARKVQLAVLLDLLFADDCALVAHTHAELFDRFFNAAKRFGLTVSLKKTEAMCQSHPPSQTASVRITAGDDTVLKCVDKFCYLGSFVSNTISVDIDITSRLAKAGCALQKRLWGVHDVSMETKVAVYQAIVTGHHKVSLECLPSEEEEHLHHTITVQCSVPP